MKNRTLSVLLGFSLFWVNLLSGAPFWFRATVDPNFVLLSWNELEDVDGFNIYRKTGGGVYAKINSTPIIPLTNCSLIRAIIPSGSPEDIAIDRILDVDACAINLIPSFPSPGQKEAWLKMRDHLSLLYYKISRVRGLAYVDSGVTTNQIYYYAIKAVKAGEETTLVSDLKVKAGVVSLLPPPAGLAADSGDARIFLYWDELEGSIGYSVYRSTSAGGSYSLLDSLLKGKFIINPITLDTLKTPGGLGKPGFLDTTCVNDTTYYYKVQALDLLSRPGSLSTIIHATPRDKTPPETPKAIVVQPAGYGLKLTWGKVVKDVAGRTERTAGYNIYRYRTFEDANLDSFGIKVGYVPQPPDTITNLNFEESYPAIEPDTVYWYRINCEDKAIPVHNVSTKSAVVSGFFKDTIPPKAPTDLITDAYEDSIVLSWTPPTAPDLAGFYVYRGICGCDTVYVYRNEETGEVKESKKEITMLRGGWRFVRKYCRPYTLALIANIDSAKATEYVDRSLPEGSPICYRYGVKAYDKNQNLSEMSEPICDRLKDRTGPPAPVIAGLKARNRAILVQWVAPPMQDLFGFVVERSETGSNPWEKVSDSLKFPRTVTCGDIPATNIWAANTTFSFLDTTVLPKQTYWYRIRAADYNGNSGHPSVPIETYTFDFSGPPHPVGLSLVQPSGQCALKITWSPPFDTTYLGFVVFRSSKKDCCYRQVSPIIQGNEFIDKKVVAGKTYWYKVQYFGKEGNRSEVSSPKSGMATP